MKIAAKIFKITFRIYLFLWIVSIVAALNNINEIPVLVLLLPIEVYFILSFWKKKAMLSTVSGIFAFLALVSSFLIFIADVGYAKNMTNVLFSLSIAPVFLYFLVINLDTIIRFFAKKKDRQITADLKKDIKMPVIDEKKRAFIKIAAGFGIGGLLLYLFGSKNAQAAFFGSIPGPGTIAVKDSTGTKIDPAIKSPTDGYGLMNVIDTGDFPHYFGFVNKDGGWYILKEVGDGSFLYTKGGSGYDWSARAGQNYASFDSTF